MERELEICGNIYMRSLGFTLGFRADDDEMFWYKLLLTEASARLLARLVS